eukprot:scaffold8214_cov121-Isochrysis_galbana.AAC.1
MVVSSGDANVTAILATSPVDELSILPGTTGFALSFGLLARWVVGGYGLIHAAPPCRASCRPADLE